MKILKKSLALILVFAIAMSLVTVSATEDTNVYIGSKTLVTSAEAQQVIIPVFIKTTDATSVNGIACELSFDTDVLTLNNISFKAAGLTSMSNVGVKKIAGVDFGSLNHAYTYDDADVTNDAAANFALLTFTVAANAEEGTYEINGSMIAGNTNHAATDGDPSTNESVADEFTVVSGAVVLEEKQYINAVEGYTVEDAIEYGAEEPELPYTVKGLGKTSRDVDITTEDDIDLDVAWDSIDTLQAPGAYTVEGIVAEPVSDTIEFKSEDYAEDVDTLTAVANYKIAKSTEGVVADVAIDTEERFGGAASNVEAIVALEEVAAVTTTTIKLANADAEEETVTLNWAEAVAAISGDTLDISNAGDSIVLNVPVTGETVYYDIDDAVAVVTITVKPAVKMYNAIDDVTVETAVEYGAESELVLPEIVTGTGMTVGGQEITAENSDEFAVAWGDIATLQTPGAKTVDGTVAEPVSDTISFKNNDYTEDVNSLPVVANYTVVRSTAGVVAPVDTIEVRVKDAGVETDIEGLIVLPELTAVETTTITIDVDGAAVETVSLNWAEAYVASDEDTTLNLGSDSDSIVLKVPLAGDTTYYNLEGKFVTVTVQMIPAWDFGDVNHDEQVTFTDAQLTAAYAIVGAVSGTFDELMADVDGATGVTFTDAQMIAKKAIDSTFVFPVEQ